MKVAERQFQLGPLEVAVYATKELLGKAAAEDAAKHIRSAIAKCGKARVIFAAANSQLEMAENLVAAEGIDWKAVEAFHLDEYVGLRSPHPASFGGWVKRNIVDRVHPGSVHYIAGDAADKHAECERYAALLSEEPIDVSFLGIGETGILRLTIRTRQIFPIQRR